MKWIKKFEELDPDKFRKAGRLLKGINKEIKGQRIIDHANEREFGKYNTLFAFNRNGSSYSNVLNKHKDIQMNDNGLIPIELTSPSFSFRYFKEEYDGTVEDLIDDWSHGNNSLSFTIDYSFLPIGESINTVESFKSSLTNKLLPLFSLEFVICGSVGDIDDSQYDNASTMFDDFVESKGFSVIIDKPLDKTGTTDGDFGGIFIDRKSANKFKKECLGRSIEKFHSEIFEIFSILSSREKYYSEFMEFIKNIKVNRIYDDELNQKNIKNGYLNTTSRWYGKIIT